MSETSLTKWEYRVLVKQTDRQMVLELNQMGREGWEAMTLTYDKDLKGVWNWTAWLKRPIGAWSDPSAVVAAGGALQEEAKREYKGFDLGEGDFELKD